MDKSGYDFRIQCAEIDKEDIKYFKQLNHCRPVLLIGFWLTNVLLFNAVGPRSNRVMH
jgi:hypothetical protein